MSSAEKVGLPLMFAEVDFSADTWAIRNETPGQVKRYATMQWARPLSNGETLCDPQHRALLFSLKCFVWSLVYKPQESAATSAGGISSLSGPIRDLACFLTNQGIEDLDQIDTADSWAFAEEVVELHQETTRDSPTRGMSRKPSHAGIIRSINVLTLIYRQRRAIESLGGKSLRLPPYGGSKPFKVVSKDLGLQRGPGKIPPLRDQVAIPILNSATRMMDNSAEGLIAATDELLTIRGFAEDWAKIRPVDLVNIYLKLNDLCKRAAIRMPDGDGGQFPLSQPVSKVDADGREFVLDSPLKVLRYLLTSCVAACSVVLQAGTGMRTHELLSLQALPLKEDGWPACLYRRVSQDQMVDLYYVQATTSKRGRPRTAEWLIGAAPTGSDYLPPTVRAVLTVNRMLAVFRDLGGLSDLFVVFKTNGGLPAAGASVRGMSNAYLAKFQRAFVLNWGNVNTTSSGDRGNDEIVKIRPHQWRPTFANFVFRTNPTMLKAISEHFKHVSDAVTSKYYIGSDPSFLTACDDARTMAAVQVLRSITFRSAPVVGGFARYIDQMRAGLKVQLINDSSVFDELAAMRYVKEEEVELWSTPYGRCWASQLPTKSLCNQRAGVTALGSTKPNLAIAHVDLCAGCGCLEISTEHEAFWIERRDQNALLAQEAKNADDRITLSISQRRQKQADALVKRLAASSDAPES